MTEIDRIAEAMKQELLRFDEQIQLLVSEAVRLSRHINEMRLTGHALHDQTTKLQEAARHG